METAETKQNRNTKKLAERLATENSWRSSRCREMQETCKRHCLLAKNQWGHRETHKQVWDMSETQKQTNKTTHAGVWRTMGEGRSRSLSSERQRLHSCHWLLFKFSRKGLLSSTSASCVITQAKSIFARHGIPNIVVSDNGPCFSCKEWHEFSVHYDFKHVTSSPLYGQSNGKAEKGVHILKQPLKKADDSNSDPYLALLSYRASPLECGLSPAELLMNRRIRTTLPFYLRKEWQHTMLQKKLVQLKAKQKTNYDRSAKCLQPLSRNDQVRIEGPETWDRKATVLQEVGPRSYIVRTEEVQVLRWNRHSLLKTPEAVQEHNTVESESYPAPSELSNNKTGTDSHHNTEKHRDTPDTHVLRRSTRQKKKPDKLDL